MTRRFSVQGDRTPSYDYVDGDVATMRMAWPIYRDFATVRLHSKPRTFSEFASTIDSGDIPFVVAVPSAIDQHIHGNEANTVTLVSVISADEHRVRFSADTVTGVMLISAVEHAQFHDAATVTLDTDAFQATIDSGTPTMVGSASAIERKQSFDAATARVQPIIGASTESHTRTSVATATVVGVATASDQISFSDDDTGTVVGASFALEMVEYHDAADAHTVIASLGAEAVEYHDVGVFAFVAAKPSATDTHHGIDAKTVTFTPFISGTDLLNNEDASAVPVLAVPSATNTYHAVDAQTATMTAQTAQVENHHGIDAATITATLTPSATDADQHIDADTITSTLTPSAAETKQSIDAATVTVVTARVSADIKQSVDAATPTLTAVPSSTNTLQAVDANTATTTVAVIGTVETRTQTDANTATMTSAVSATETHRNVDAATVTLTAVPSSTNTHQNVDAATVSTTGTPSAVEKHMWIRTGFFNKETSNVNNTTQAITGLPFKPGAVMFIVSQNNNNDSSQTDINQTIGFGIDSTHQDSHGYAMSQGGANSNAGRRALAKALSVITPGGAITAAADIAMDNNGFTLTWTTSSGRGNRIGYIAFSQDLQTKIIDWTTNTATGNQAVTGAGFQPDAVIHVLTAATALNTAAAGATGCVGTMCSGGTQWANGVFSVDAVAGSSDTQRIQRTDSCIVGVDASLSAINRAHYGSMDADGFTVNWDTAPASAFHVFSLCIKGVNAKAVSFNKTTSAAPVTQAITGVGFRPGMLLMRTFSQPAGTGGVANSRMATGISDTVNEWSMALSNTDVTSPQVARGIMSITKGIVTCNNSTIAFDAAADVQSMDSDGFTLNWTTNDANAHEILALALKPS